MPYPLTPAAFDAAFTAFDLSFQEALRNQKTIWDRIASKKTSKTESETYAWSDLIPELRKWEGERIINQLSGRAQVLKNDTYEDTVGIKRPKLEDDTYGIYIDPVRQLGEASGRWPDKLVIDALQAGTTTKVYDNQNFFDSNHPVNPDDPASAVQSNNLDFSSSGYNGGTAGFTSDNVAGAIATMKSLLGANGIPLEVMPNLMLVPPQREFQARKILNAALVAVSQGSGAAAVDNQIQKTVDTMVDVVVGTRLANDPNVIYLLDTSRVVKPLIFQERIPPTTQIKNREEDENVFSRDEYLFGVRARGAGGYGPWWLAQRIKIA